VIGLARMAVALACNRVYGFTPLPEANVLPRDDEATREGSCSFEYYRIIDRIARGENT
jgi:hypothetical protein